MLKLASPSIIPHLTALFTTSFYTSIFPTACKNSHIRALFKIMTPNSPSDTRLIALLAEMAKVQERRAFDHLLNYFETNNLFTPCQACYRKGHITQTALLGVLQNIPKRIEELRGTLSNHFEFGIFKAFDCIPYKRLLDKLHKYTFSNLAIK